MEELSDLASTVFVINGQSVPIGQITREQQVRRWPL